jgi:hypothetical protein
MDFNGLQCFNTNADSLPNKLGELMTRIQDGKNSYEVIGITEIYPKNCSVTFFTVCLFVPVILHNSFTIAISSTFLSFGSVFFDSSALNIIILLFQLNDLTYIGIAPLVRKKQ